MRVLLLNNVPAPYFDPLFERLGRESGWELTVCYSSAWNRAVGWEKGDRQLNPAYRTVILDRQWTWLCEWFGSSLAATIALFTVLWRKRPDYLICYGYTLLPQTVLLLWGLATRTPFAMVGDANVYTDVARGWRRTVKSGWLRLIVWQAAALIAVGTAGRMFWARYGARAEQRFEARFAVDNEFYAKASATRKGEAAALRLRFGLTGKIVFLFVGRLIERKNVDLLIRAAKALNDKRCAVVIAGDGEERGALERLAKGDSRVIFAGRVVPSELPLFYAMADVLVLPAREEPWGLVINEAMACGLAIIAHQHCGATVDLVTPKNGVALDTFCAEELSHAMQGILEDETRLRAMQHASREKIAAWSIEAAVCGMIGAVETSLKRKGLKPVPQKSEL